MMNLRTLAGLLALTAVVEGFQGLTTLATTNNKRVVPTTFPRALDEVTVTSRRALQQQGPTLLRRRNAPLYATIGSTSNNYDYNCDVLVLGSGPAARSVASLLGANDLQVVLADKNEQREWPPNYGVWQDEWQAILDKYASMGVKLEGGNEGQCVDRAWPVTDCYFGGSFDIPTENRMRLDRPYYRVDRFALRK